MIKTLFFGLLLFCCPLRAAELIFDYEDEEKAPQATAAPSSVEKPACKTNDDCQFGEYCDTASSRCVSGCRADTDCAPEQVCKNQICIELCQDSINSYGEKCAGTTPVCFVEDKGHSSYCGCSDSSCYDGNKCTFVGGRRECKACRKTERCNCPPAYKPDGLGGCEPCPSGETCGCVSMKANGNGQCVTCTQSADCPDKMKCVNSQKTNSECVPIECAAGQYADENLCSSCFIIPHCTACTSSTDCTVCEEGFGVLSGECTACPAATKDDKCTACSGSVCTKCQTGFQLKDGKCAPIVCQSGKYLSGNDCLPCPAGCSQCTSPDSCLACNIGFEPVGTQCKAIACEPRTYLKGNFCVSCLPDCEQCANSDSCLQCKKGYFFDAERRACVLRVCERGTFKDDATGECRPCTIEHCTACDANSCFGCAAGYDLRGEKCVPEKCPDGCKACSTPDSCDVCDTGYELYEGTCAAIDCPDGKYLSGSTCRNCPPGCGKCSDAQTCLACSSSEYYLSGTLCRKCAGALSDCETCSDAKTCLSCKNGKTLKNGRCV